MLYGKSEHIKSTMLLGIFFITSRQSPFTILWIDFFMFKFLKSKRTIFQVLIHWLLYHKQLFQNKAKRIYFLCLRLLCLFPISYLLILQQHQLFHSRIY